MDDGSKNERVLISTKKHFIRILALSIAIWTLLGCILAPIFPAYDWKYGALNLSLVWFLPGAVISGLMISYPLHRFIVVALLDSPSPEVPLSPLSKIGEALLRPRYFFIHLLALLVIYVSGEMIRFAYYRSIINGEIPGLSLSKHEVVRENTLDYFAGNPNPKALKALIQTIEHDDDGDIPSTAAAAIASLGEAYSLPALIRIIKDDVEAGYKFPFEGILSLLNDIGSDKVIKYMSAILENDCDSETRFAAVLTLWWLEDSKKTANYLERALINDSCTNVRVLAAEALGKMGAVKTDLFEGMANDSDAAVRQKVREILMDCHLDRLRGLQE